MTQSEAAALLEKITRIIPGIAGYQDREKRRDADKAVRTKAAGEVARCRELLSETMNDLSRSGSFRNLKVVGSLERTVTNLERTEDELRFAPPGYAGWFDREGVSLEDLERIYEYDLGLLNAAQTLLDYAGDSDRAATDQDWVTGLDEALGNLRDALEGRKRIVEGQEADSE
ncbi:MAG: hypothetical protein PVJ01_00685 [Pseudomonadota bacterium]|jgi:hypothetical protein